ncbi:uncharacterized protein LOC110044222 isoform X2 [Orbicella faveolata]|uniref:uncharacterized protein LOC110044222 isoform X2 n=1 Tax=Orbicella faveolata TaxID=48498 RepID=UPI0009E1B1FF|nr:uncharacterized protein LOC110044222 isoform X2 [Orbicella faveolata]
MSQPQRELHLFNCDRTYKLEAVEALLNATKAKLGFDPVVKKHYFSLAQMSEMTTNIIPKLQMDIAFFVVHAHESRLSINEDDAGIGYANIYRALLKRTGGKVIIVIGGDDNYRSEDEKDRVVISRWAWRKISSQFSEEFLDGRSSFIFSWNNQHREIHEEALLHFFDLNKKGQKFEYQPKPKQLDDRLQKYQSMDEQIGREGTGSSNSTSAEQRRRDFASGHSYKSAQTSSEGTPLHKDHSMNEQRGEANGSRSSSSAEQRREDFSVGRSRSADETREQSPFGRSNVAEQTRDDYSFGSTTRTAMTTYDSEHGAKSKETPSASTGRTKVTELAILGCNVSKDSVRAAWQLFEDIRPRLNLAPNPPVKNLVPPDVKRYLTENRLKFCVLVVDAETVKDAYDKLTQRKVEYEDLLETAADKVDKKVIILMCDTCSFKSKDDETTVMQTMEHIINKKGKGFLACLKNGKLSVDPDVLVQCLMSTSPSPAPDFQEKNRDAPGAAAESYSSQLTNPPIFLNGEPILLRSLLFNGRISYALEHLQLWDPTFTVPDHINQNLFQQYQYTPVTGVTILQGTDGALRWPVDPKLIEVSRSRYEGIQIANNETLLLKTRIRNGLVSFEENDVHFRHGNWQIPQHITESFKAEYSSTPKGELWIISDDKQNLRCIIKIGTLNKMFTYVKKKYKAGYSLVLK